MTGGVKSGLIFALAAVVLVVVVAFVPTVGVLCCGPLGVMLLGTLAGYIGVRWSGPAARIIQGVLAGALTGAGAMVGSILAFVVLIWVARSFVPELYSQLLQQIDDVFRQQGGGQPSPEERELFLNLAIGAGGICLGTINLAFALGAGALGGWLAVRQRQGQAPPLTMPPSPM